MALLVVMLVMSAMATSVPYKNCGGSITIGEVDITPYPIVKGQNAQLSMNGIAGADVADGQYKITAAAFGVVLKTITGQFTEVITNVPFKTGDNVTVSYGLTIPAYAPSIKVDLEFSGTDTDNNKVFCFDFSSQVTLDIQ
jgi:hypothetical protein